MRCSGVASIRPLYSIRCGECPHAIDMNSDGWQKGVTNVPPGASRDLADHNVKMFLAASAMPWMGSVGGGCMARSLFANPRSFYQNKVENTKRSVRARLGGLVVDLFGK